MSEDDPEGFATYPRGRLSLKLGRRQVLSILSTEIRVREAQRRGVGAYKLTDLGNMPDNLLELLTPVLVEDVRVYEDGGSVWGSHGQEAATRLFSARSAAASALPHFNGDMSLYGIAHQVGEAQGWQANRAFAYVRGMFLHLVTLGLCRPK